VFGLLPLQILHGREEVINHIDRIRKTIRSTRFYILDEGVEALEALEEHREV
jgi:hypothetical protein